MPPRSFPELPRDAAVRDALLGLDHVERRRREGKPCWDLTLGGRSGRIDSAPGRRDWP